MTLALLFLGLFVLLMTGLPIFAGISLVALLSSWFASGTIQGLVEIFVGEVSNYLLVAIALFALMANIMVRIRAVDDLFHFAHVVTKHLPGGLGVATILTCTIFAAIIGSSVATALTVGSIAIPQMRRYGYTTARACGVVAGGATLGILIPPSGPMILYSLVTDASVGALFMAGILPGLVLAALFAAAHVIMAVHAHDLKTEPRATWGETWGAFVKASPSLCLPVVILGGIYGGFFTATEAASAGVVGALLIGALHYRNLSFASVFDASMAAAMTTAMVLMIVGASAMFSNVVTLLQLPNQILEGISALGLGPVQFLILMMLCLLVLGMFLEAVAIILITTPVVLPTLIAMDINLVWYGILLVIALEVAQISPPVGLNLFVMKAVTGASLGTVMKGSVPYLVIMLVFLFAAVLLPGAILWLPRLTGYG
ncbi:MAG: TRAP transporter large permease [Pseudooceanicola sp.]|nr:TRAP transporter large permease [Pseudooceanicola sp.]